MNKKNFHKSTLSHSDLPPQIEQLRPFFCCLKPDLQLKALHRKLNTDSKLKCLTIESIRQIVVRLLGEENISIFSYSSFFPLAKLEKEPNSLVYWFNELGSDKFMKLVKVIRNLRKIKTLKDLKDVDPAIGQLYLQFNQLSKKKKLDEKISLFLSIPNYQSNLNDLNSKIRSAWRNDKKEKKNKGGSQSAFPSPTQTNERDKESKVPQIVCQQELDEYFDGRQIDGPKMMMINEVDEDLYLKRWSGDCQMWEEN